MSTRISKDPYLFPDRSGVGDLGDFGPTRTVQAPAEDVDINTIVARALKSGFLADTNAIAGREAIFADFSGVGSYADSLNRVIAAQRAFDELPVNVKNRFKNDPGLLMEFVGNEANLVEAVDLGLIDKDRVKDKLAALKAAKDAAAAAAAANVPK